MTSSWLKKQVSDVEHVRDAVLASALVLGVLGFVMVAAALLAR